MRELQRFLNLFFYGDSQKPCWDARRYSQTALLLPSVQEYNKQKLSHPGVFRHLQAVTPLLPHTPTYLPQAQPNQYIISQFLHSSPGLLLCSPLTFHTISCCFSSILLWPPPTPPTHPHFAALLLVFCVFLCTHCWCGKKRDKNDSRGVKGVRERFEPSGREGDGVREQKYEGWGRKKQGRDGEREGEGSLVGWLWGWNECVIAL